MRHRIFAVIAAAAAGAACLTGPALARGGGSGGHGGSAGHGGFASHGTAFGFGFGARGGGFFGHGGGLFAHGGVSAARGATAFGLHRAAVTGRVLTPIRPEVINVPATLGTGAIVPPFSGAPIVPPFGAVPIETPFGRGAANGRFPAVTTPYGSVPAFGYQVAPDAPRVAVAPGTLPALDTGAQAIGTPEANPADPNTLHGACHPVPHGYHCDWSS